MEEKNSWYLYLAGFLGLGIISILVILGNAQLNNRETVLLCILLALLGLGAGFLLAQFLDSLTRRKEMEKVMAGVADKVENLSGELQRFAAFLAEELKKDYKDPAEGYHTRTERLESAIHVINTLRSVNDASLNEWRGQAAGKLEPRTK